MKNVLMASMSAGIMLTAVSCKEKNEEAVNQKVEASAPLTKSSTNEIPTEEKKLKEAVKVIGWIMQDMEVPEYKLKKLHEKGEFFTETYLKYASDIVNNAKRVSQVDHPDKKFVGLANDMLKAMSDFEAAFTSKNVEEVKSKWDALTKSCAACHKDYKKGGGGY